MAATHILTTDQVVFFIVYSVGLNLGGHEVSGIDVKPNDEEATFVTPEASVTLSYGDVMGSEIADSVESYEGPTLLAGASFGSTAIEGFTSVDPETGIPNTNASGYTLGVTSGAAPVEAHVVYANTIFIPAYSNALTHIFRVLGIIQ